MVDEGEKEADIPLSYGREEEGGSDRGGGKAVMREREGGGKEWEGGW